MDLLNRILRIIAHGLDPEHPHTQQQSSTKGNHDSERQQIAASLDALTKQLETNEKSRQEHDGNVAAIDRERLGLEKVVMYTVIIGTAAALTTLCFVKRSTDAAATSANAAVTQASAAERQTRLLNDQILKGQRAYVLVERGKLAAHPLLGQRAQIEFTLINSGQTPAANVGTTIFRRVNPSEPGAVKYPLEKFSGSINIGAGRTRQAFGGANETPFMKNEIDGLRRGERLFFLGMVRYEDVFGAVNFTEFCYTYIPGDLELAFCDTHNEMRLSVPPPPPAASSQGQPGQKQDQPK